MSRTARRTPTRSGRRGRPPKYGRPSQVVAVTLPQEIVDTLQRQHGDLGWAIVQLVEHTRRSEPGALRQTDAELVQVGDGLSLIVVPTGLIGSLPNVQLIPLSADHAFLALEPGCGLADLEVAVIDRLESKTAPKKARAAILRFRRQLRAWRTDPFLTFQVRSIILVGRR